MWSACNIYTLRLLPVYDQTKNIPAIHAATAGGTISVVIVAKPTCLNWFVQECGNVFFSIPMRCAEHHHTVLDGQRIQVVQHHMIGFGQQRRFALKQQAGIKTTRSSWTDHQSPNARKPTDNGVSLLSMTWSRWGGRTGGPVTFSHGLVAVGITCEYSFCALLMASSLSLASASNTSKSDLRTDTRLFLVPISLSMFFYMFIHKQDSS